MRTTLITLGLAAALVAACTSSGGATEMQATSGTCTAPEGVAHRGGYADWGDTEDTLWAYTWAGRYGINLWETDIHPDKYGVPYLMHDNTIDRTTNGTGPASAVNIASTAVRMNDGQYLRNQTLDKLISLASGQGADVLIEPKVVFTASQVSKVLTVLDRYAWRGHVVVNSFETANLAPFKAQAPGLTYSLVTQVVVTPSAAKAVGPILNIKDSLLTPALVASYHAAGVQVYAWTVDKATDWDAHKGYGIDRYVTNRPADLRGWRDYACTGIEWGAS